MTSSFLKNLFGFPKILVLWGFSEGIPVSLPPVFVAGFVSEFVASYLKINEILYFVYTFQKILLYFTYRGIVFLEIIIAD